MWLKLLSGYLLLLWLVVPVWGAEQQYTVTEVQLQSIEQSLQRLELDRRNWQEQAHDLRNEAANLNTLLKAEREKYKTLQTLFNKYEDTQSEAMAVMEKDLNKIREQKQVAESKAKTTAWQRNAFAVTCLLLAVLCGIVFWFRK